MAIIAAVSVSPFNLACAPLPFFFIVGCNCNGRAQWRGRMSEREEGDLLKLVANSDDGRDSSSSSRCNEAMATATTTTTTTTSAAAAVADDYDVECERREYEWAFCLLLLLFLPARDSIIMRTRWRWCARWWLG